MAPNVNQYFVKSLVSSGMGMISSNASAETRAQSAIEVATNALSMLFGAMADAQEEARQNVRNVKEKTNDIETATQTQVETNKKAIESITSKIEENQSQIEEILKTINDFEDEKEDINAEVEEHKKELEKQKAAYENATTQEERDKALAAISNENKSIQELLTRVQAIGKQQEELNKQGEDLQAINGDLGKESQDTITDGEQKVKALNAQAVANKAETATLAGLEAKYMTKAAEYIALATAAKTSGTVAGALTFGLGNAAGEIEYQKYMNLAQQCITASGIINSGVAEIMPTIVNIFDGTTDNLGFLTNSSTAIGSQLSAANDSTEKFLGISNALGSWLENTQSWQDTSDKITSATETAQSESSDNSDTKNDDSKDGDAGQEDSEKKKFNAEIDFSVDVA